LDLLNRVVGTRHRKNGQGDQADALPFAVVAAVVILALIARARDVLPNSENRPILDRASADFWT
jgi:hypothetical protein